MPHGRFHRQPFDEGTRTKLDIFQLYTRKWLPVFMSKPGWRAVHVFDFFAGPGTDGEGSPGSPLRLLAEIGDARRLAGTSGLEPTLHLFDSSAGKVDELRRTVDRLSVSGGDGGAPDIQELKFQDALEKYADVLDDPSSAKLLLIDQFGVGEVLDDTFRRLVSFPRTDFLFFISSSTLHRFREHPAIKQKIRRPDDTYHVHRAVLEFYQRLLPNRASYWLAPFSIRKGANIYGIIFGSAHPLGMDKFLQVAWKQDHINGEANFDINREDLGSPQLPLFGERRPTKVVAFECDLEAHIRSGAVRSELDVIRICFDHGVLRSHARPVLNALKREGCITPAFQVPDIRRWRSPRPITTTVAPVPPARSS